MHRLSHFTYMPTIVTGSIGPDHYRTTLHTKSHTLLSDESLANGGQDAGPAPDQLVLSALAACKLITVRMYVDRKGWSVDLISVELEMHVDYAARPAANTDIRCRIHAEGALDEAQRQRIVTIADKCPTHRLLTGEVAIASEWAADVASN
ncbi:MAG: OsmC family peroxiredoxin [Bacteroidetes bacterium]|nr:MAG: OsmC family peroxiredoxin [Bacteroidota bacterium]